MSLKTISSTMSSPTTWWTTCWSKWAKSNWRKKRSSRRNQANSPDTSTSGSSIKKCSQTTSRDTAWTSDSKRTSTRWTWFTICTTGSVRALRAQCLLKQVTTMTGYRARPKTQWSRTSINECTLPRTRAWWTTKETDSFSRAESFSTTSTKSRARSSRNSNCTMTCML